MDFGVVVLGSTAVRVEWNKMGRNVWKCPSSIWNLACDSFVISCGNIAKGCETKNL